MFRLLRVSKLATLVANGTGTGKWQGFATSFATAFARGASLFFNTLAALAFPPLLPASRLAAVFALALSSSARRRFWVMQEPSSVRSKKAMTASLIASLATRFSFSSSDGSVPPFRHIAMSRSMY